MLNVTLHRVAKRARQHLPSLTGWTAAVVVLAAVFPGTLPASAQEQKPSQTPQPPEQSKHFVLSQEIQGTELHAERREAIRSLMFDTLSDSQRERTEKVACSPFLAPAEPKNEKVKTALNVVNTSLAPEILFGKGAPGNEPETPDFSMSLTFEQDHLLAKLSSPRFPSESAGLKIPYPAQPTRTVWIEGKGPTDMFVIIPAVRGCSLKAVVLCPRTYVTQGILEPSEYTPIGIRYSYGTKIDGLYALEESISGTLRGSLRATTGIPLPKKWYSEDSGKLTPSVSLKYNSSTERSIPAFISGEAPLLGGVEASLELGQGDRLLARSFNRSNIEVREFPMKDPLMTTSSNANLRVEPGMCYLVTQWQEMEN